MKTKAKEIISFFVPGIPMTAGSKTPRRSKKSGKMYAHDSCKGGPAWRASVQGRALEEVGGGWELWTGPIALFVEFYLPRPKGHYGTGRNHDELKPSAPMAHIVKPDTTKMFRAVEDALNKVIWRDDAQIVNQGASKHYGDRPGAMVTVHKLAAEGGDASQ